MNEFAEYNYLCHYGILGMKWGVRRYQNKDGSLTAAGKKHYGGNERDKDFVLKKNATLQTLSADPNRTKDTDYFYAAYTKNDKDFYNGYFAKDMNKKVLGIVPTVKLSIHNKLVKDVKVASEDSGSKVMNDLYNKDDDFKDFVNNPERMQKIMRHDGKHKAYVDAMNTLKSITENGEASPEEIKEVYKIFNYILPNDGMGDTAVGEDVANQRKKFFSALKDNGYGAVLDTNDAYYGNYGNYVDKPVIMFDMDQIIPQNITKMSLVDAQIANYKANVKKKIQDFKKETR